MAKDVVLPQWGMNMQDGTLTKWLKREGDSVQQGEPLVEVETAKINSALEAPTAGIVAHILIPEGQTVAIGTVVAIIAAPGEQVARPAAPAPAAPPPPAAPTPSFTASPRLPPGGPAIQALPAARRLAQQHGIDLAQVRGTGPGGRITEADVTRSVEGRTQPAAAQQPTAVAPSAADVAPLSGIRKTVAQRMHQSLQTMAQVTLTTEADVSELVALRKELVGAWRTYRLRPLDQDLVVKAAARALQEHPRLNATLEGNEIRRWKEINVSIALALPDGLTVGVVRNTDKKLLVEVAQEIRGLVAKAKDGTFTLDDVTGGTFTISSLAAFDIDGFTPIINPPQVAILGIGRIVEKPVVHQGEIAKRSTMVLSLTFDHRALDGVPAAQFLQAVKRHLEAPRWMAA